MHIVIKYFYSKKWQFFNIKQNFIFIMNFSIQYDNKIIFREINIFIYFNFMGVKLFCFVFRFREIGASRRRSVSKMIRKRRRIWGFVMAAES